MQWPGLSKYEVNSRCCFQYLAFGKPCAQNVGVYVTPREPFKEAAGEHNQYLVEPLWGRAHGLPEKQPPQAHMNPKQPSIIRCAERHLKAPSHLNHGFKATIPMEIGSVFCMACLCAETVQLILNRRKALAVYLMVWGMHELSHDKLSTLGLLDTWQQVQCQKVLPVECFYKTVVQFG